MKFLNCDYFISMKFSFKVFQDLNLYFPGEYVSSLLLNFLMFIGFLQPIVEYIVQPIIKLKTNWEINNIFDLQIIYRAWPQFQYPWRDCIGNFKRVPKLIDLNFGFTTVPITLPMNEISMISIWNTCSFLFWFLYISDFRSLKLISFKVKAILSLKVFIIYFKN